MTVLSSGECGAYGTPPPPPPPPVCSTAAPVTPPSTTSQQQRSNGTVNGGAASDKNLLMADIRNGVALKPTKTKDKSTPAFIKKSSGTNGSIPPSPAQFNGCNVDNSIGEMKDALQEELRNTLRRKVKKQDVERGDCSKKDEIEKAMESSRTEVQLKVNTSPKATFLADMFKNGHVQSDSIKEDKSISASNDAQVKGKTSPFLDKKEVFNSTSSKNSEIQSSPIKTQQLNNNSIKPLQSVNGNDTVAPHSVEVNQNLVLSKPPVLIKSEIASNAKPVAPVSSVSNDKDLPKKHSQVKVEIKPFESSRMPLNGTLRKVSPQKALTIDVSTRHDDRLKSTILSPDVISGNAAIRPSQIKSLTQKGSHVSHTDILENPKPFSKSPISLVESSKYSYTPPTPKSVSPASSGQASPRTPTRTTILDTKISHSVLTPKPADPNAPQKKLMISHPKASFTLKRSTSNNQKVECGQSTEPKPVFRILSNLEQSERLEAECENKTSPNQSSARKDPPKADDPGVEPVLTSYVSFAKELANAPNNYPDVVTKHTTVGVVKQDLFFDNTNLRDIKIDINEGGGQLKVVNK